MSRSAVWVGVGVGGAALALLFIASAGSSAGGWEEGKVMGIDAESWIEKVLAKTAAHEGRPWSTNANLDGAGLSYGILQWTQRSGNLGRVLRAMYAADPASFVRILGAGSTSVAGELLRATLAASMGPVAGALLWRAPWLARFAEAGKVPAFQAAQAHIAATSEYMQGALAVADVLGIRTERAVSLYFDRCVQQGPAGALGPAQRLAAAWTSGQITRPVGTVAALSQYAWVCAARFRRTSAPSSSWFNSAKTIRWVALAAGAPEYDLSPDGRLVRRAQQGRTWHAVTGSWDLWDDILKRSSDVLLDRGLGEGGVGK